MKRMDTSITFLVPVEMKLKFWRLSHEKGLLPSQLLREMVSRVVENHEVNKEKRGGA